MATGCSQNPEFRANLANQAYGSLNQLYVLLAEAELGALRSPSSFASEVETYATIIGGFEVSRLIVAGRPASRTASEAASLEDLGGAIGHCVAQVKRLSEMHRTNGIASGSAMIGSVRGSCDTAARLVAANEVSSWIFTTAAGDL
jgi:hypothetical protein